MRKILNIVKALAVSLAAVSLLAGCSGEAKVEPVNSYTADSGMYSVSLPGEWKEESNMGMADMINLSRSDGSEAVFIGMVKGQVMGAAGSDVESLEDFFDYMDSLFLNGEASTTELSDTEAVSLAGITSTIAKEGTMKQKTGGSGKVFVQCAETENAYYLMMFSASKGYNKKVASIKKNLAFEELEVPVPETLSDTLRWFNASYAVITTLNGGSLDLVAGFEPSDMIASSMKAMLQRDWSISDKASLEENINWLLTEGHNKEALDYLAESETDGMSREDLISSMEESGFDAENQAVMLAAFDAKASYGDLAISGWDLSRAMSLIGWGYLSGYYTYEEAMDKSLETAQSIQQSFGSWDDFMNSYFYGYSYWSGNDPEDTSSQAYTRRQMYEEIKGDEKGVYGVDFKAQLAKEW